MTEIPATYAAALLLKTYTGLLVFSAALAGMLWYAGRERVHKLTFLIWVSGFLCIGLQGLFLKFNLAMVLSFSSAILPVMSLVGLIGMSARADLPYRRYWIVYGLSVACAAAASLLQGPFWAMALPVALAAAYPPVDASFRAWPGGKEDPTRLLKVLCVVSFLYGVHHLAYPFLRQSEVAAPYGYTVAIGLFFMLSIILPAYTTASLAAEYSGRLEGEVAARTAELRSAQDRVVRAEKLAAIGKLASGVGHELRNPLGAVRNAVYYLRDALAGSEAVREDPALVEFLDLAEREIKHAARIISDLLGYSRAVRLACEPTDVSELASVVMKSLELPPTVRLRETYQSGLPRAMIDPLRVQQVVFNLATNAVQAMAQDGGELGLLTRGEEEGGRTAWIIVEVRDTGEGITPENRTRLFEPLFTTRAKGTGLGLAISRSYVEAHGGSILVSSAPGWGSTFSVRLPVGAPPRRPNLEMGTGRV